MIELSGPTFEPVSKDTPKQLVIMLHGLGADGNDLISLAPYFAKQLPDALFMAPDAPYPCDMAPFGKQWFSLSERSEDAILQGIQKIEPILNHFISQQRQALDLDPKDVALVGFSQGTMLSLHVSLRHSEALGAVMGYSGALVAPQLLTSELKAKPPVCLVHGEADEVVPFDAFNQALATLQKNDVLVQGYSQKGLGHGIDPAGVEIGTSFLEQSFAL